MLAGVAHVEQAGTYSRQPRSAASLWAPLEALHPVRLHCCPSPWLREMETAKAPRTNTRMSTDWELQSLTRNCCSFKRIARQCACDRGLGHPQSWPKGTSRYGPARLVHMVSKLFNLRRSCRRMVGPHGDGRHRGCSIQSAIDLSMSIFGMQTRYAVWFLVCPTMSHMTLTH